MDISALWFFHLTEIALYYFYKRASSLIELKNMLHENLIIRFFKIVLLKDVIYKSVRSNLYDLEIILKFWSIYD